MEPPCACQLNSSTEAAAVTNYTKLDPWNYVTQLKNTMQKLRATPPRYPTKHKAYVCKDLAHCTHVFICHDVARGPLQQPYDGPYKVVQYDDKTFTLEVNGQQKVVSLD